MATTHCLSQRPVSFAQHLSPSQAHCLCDRDDTCFISAHKKQKKRAGFTDRNQNSLPENRAFTTSRNQPGRHAFPSVTAVCQTWT